MASVPPPPGPSPDPGDAGVGRPGTTAASLAAWLRARADAMAHRFGAGATPAWRWHRVVIGIVLAEVGLALLVLLYIAVTGTSLVIGFRTPGADAPERPAPHLVIPVAGVTASQLQDTWGAPRTRTRRHLGLDIRAPAGTPVVAAAAGVVVRMDTSRQGGITLHERALDGRTVFYYAHLRGYRRGVRTGDLVRQGDTLAYVGTTGNAPPGTPHLHFAVYTVADPNDVSDGVHTNPYTLLVDAPAPADGS